MKTYTQVLEMFRDYLKKESCIEVAQTKWGYVRMFYEEPYDSSFEAVLCRTPEELFEELLDDYLASREQTLGQHGKSQEEISEEIRKTRELYLEQVPEES